MKKILLLLLLPLFLGSVLSAQKFAYVDSKYILSHIPEYARAQADINKLSMQWQKDIESKYEAISRLESALQAEKILLTDEMKRKREADIETKKQEAKEMQRQKFGVDGELFKKREEFIKPIQDQIYEAIQEVATTSSLMVVFDKANQSNMLYTNPKHDISDKVLKKMGLRPGEFQEDNDEGDEEGSKSNTQGSQTKGTKSTAPSNPGTRRK